MLKLALVEEHVLFREAIRALLDREGDFEVVLETADAREAGERLAEAEAEVVLLGPAHPGAAAELARRAPGVRIVAVGGADAGERVTVLGRGAGYRELLEALRRAPQARREAGTPGALRHLGVREREILQLLLRGYTSERIGRELGLPIAAVEGHRARIREKLGVRSLFDLFRFALHHGLLPREDDSYAA